MKKIAIIIFLCFLFISLQNTLLSQSGILWDIGKKTIFDATNKKYSMENGVVMVDLRKPNSLCPTGLGDSDRIRNERYRITIDCFDRLPGVNFKNILIKYKISLKVDVKSLHPTNPGWNRRFMP